MTLPPDLQQALYQTGLNGLQTNWGIPEVIVPLNASERVHMYNHPIASTVMPSTKEDRDAFIKQFCLSVLQSVASNMVCKSLDQAFQELTINETPIFREGLQELELPDFEIDEEFIFTDEQDTVQEPSSNNDTSSNSQSVPESTIPEATHDPSNKTMQKIAASKAKGLVGKAAGRELEEGIKSLGDQAKNAPFIKYAKRTLGAAVASAEFLAEVEAKGWKAASAELAIKYTTKFLAKYGAKFAMQAVGCTNPTYCAGMVASVIVDALEPTSTASAFDDRPPPLEYAHPPLGSLIPELDPLNPTIRNPK